MFLLDEDFFLLLSFNDIIKTFADKLWCLGLKLLSLGASQVIYTLLKHFRALGSKGTSASVMVIPDLNCVNYIVIHTWQFSKLLEIKAQVI